MAPHLGAIRYLARSAGRVTDASQAYVAVPVSPGREGPPLVRSPHEPPPYRRNTIGQEKSRTKDG